MAWVQNTNRRLLQALFNSVEINKTNRFLVSCFLAEVKRQQLYQ